MVAVRTWRRALTQMGLGTAVAATLFAAACGDSEGNDTGTPSDGGSETTTPTTGAGSPAPTEGSVVRPSPDDVSFPDAFPNLPELDRPVDMAQIPGEDWLLVLEQTGQVQGFRNDPEAAELVEVLNWTDQTHYINEEGLLGITFSPTFEDDAYVYLFYSVAGDVRRNVLSRMELTMADGTPAIDPSTELEILEVPQAYGNHNGGQLTFGPDGMLYVSLGDGGPAGDPEGEAQDRSTIKGTIVRIDVSEADVTEPYRVPDDNPFVDDPEAAPETWAYGFRNPWRMSFDPETGRLWAADVGQEGREEVNAVVPGENYGWNIAEGFICYFRNPDCDMEGLEPPVVDYERPDNLCAVIGGYAPRGEHAGVLDGYYIYGDLCAGKIWAIPADAEPGSRPEPIELLEEGEQIMSFARDADGRIYFLGLDGRIYRVDATTSLE